MPQPRRASILKRFAIVSLVALFVASCASLLLSHTYNTKDVMRESKEIVDMAAGLTKLILEDESYESLMASNDGEYEDAYGAIQEVCSLLKVRYLYIYSVNEEPGDVSYFFAVAGDAAADEAIDESMAAMEDFMSHGFEQELQALSGNADPKPLVTDTFFGRNLSWYYPLSIDGFGVPLVMRIDIDDTKVLSRIFDNTLAFAVPMIAINLLVVLVEVGLLRRDISKPLGVLSERMRSFVESGASRTVALRIGRNDEIGDIADSYNQMTGDIHRYVGQIETMTQERVAASTELSVARRIQQGLVPPTRELAGDRFEAYAFMRMAREVGGDFYDLMPLDDGRVMFVLADVSGKGVSAALFMAMCRTLLNDRLQICKDPATALNETNDVIASNNPENMFVTLVAGVFEPQSGTLTYANAGHTPPLVIGKGYQSPDPGIALGLFEDAGIINETIRLVPGEGVLFYTDGATEATNVENQFFGEERVARAAQGSSHPSDTINAVVEALDDFVGQHEQFDDLTLLSLFAREAE